MKKLLGVVAALPLVVALILVALPTGAADHLDAPAVKADGRTDITDVYAFQSKENPDNTVLIMDVNPLAGVVSGTTFDPKATYEFDVDNDGDARPDVTVSATFASQGPKGQKAKIKVDNATIGSGAVGTTIELRGGGQAWTGLADDPFFFDLVAFRDQVKGAGGSRTFCDATPTDFFAGTNVSAIVVEIP